MNGTNGMPQPLKPVTSAVSAAQRMNVLIVSPPVSGPCQRRTLGLHLGHKQRPGKQPMAFLRPETGMIMAERIVRLRQL